MLLLLLIIIICHVRQCLALHFSSFKKRNLAQFWRLLTVYYTSWKMFIPLSCFHIPPATLWRTYFCSDLTENSARFCSLWSSHRSSGFSSIIWWHSVTDSADCPLPFSTAPNHERLCMGNASFQLPALIHEISWVLSSIIYKKNWIRNSHILPIFIVVSAVAFDQGEKL